MSEPLTIYDLKDGQEYALKGKWTTSRFLGTRARDFRRAKLVSKTDDTENGWTVLKFVQNVPNDQGRREGAIMKYGPADFSIYKAARKKDESDEDFAERKKMEDPVQFFLPTEAMVLAKALPGDIAKSIAEFSGPRGGRTKRRHSKRRARKTARA